MIQWPKTLIPELAERRCIIVLGAGASAGCLDPSTGVRPPAWDKLLKESTALIAEPDLSKLANELIDKERYLDAAEIIVAKTRTSDFSQFIREKLKSPAFEPSEIHKVVYQLDAKIVLTLNYDEIYESYCRLGKGKSAYNICRYYESHALNDLRSTMRVILKAHGCVTDPVRIVLSRTQYFRARQEFQNFYNILDAIFLTNTLLFIGCSMNDPDANLLLESANIRAPSHHFHYAVMGSGTAAPLKTMMKEIHNVEVLEYPTGDYSELQADLNELLKQVMEWRRTHP